MADEHKTPLEQEELEIFGEHRTAEELAAEEARKKAEEKAARRAAYEQAKAARKEANKETRTTRIVMWCILAAVVVAVGVILALNLRSDDKYDEVEGSAHFYREDDLPEASEEGITAVINEAYFTKGGHLALKMKFTNGSTAALNLDTLEVIVYNGDEDKIASGYTASINGGDFVVPVGGYNELIYYISPEYVVLKDDPLETLAYTITCGGSEIQ